MASYLMEFYNAASGAQFGLLWSNEEEYRLGQEFLRELVGGSCGVNEYHQDRPERYYLDNERQLDALFEFRRQLRERAGRDKSSEPDPGARYR